MINRGVKDLEFDKFDESTTGDISVKIKSIDTIRNRNTMYANSIDCVKTQIGTNPEQIIFPDYCFDGIILFHIDDDTIYIGKDENITTSTALPLIKNTYLQLNIKSTSEIFAFASSGTIDLYCAGVVKL
jgi:hypothetical protein